MDWPIKPAKRWATSPGWFTARLSETDIEPSRYLAPYVYRVAISNRCVVKCQPGPDGLGRFTFTYRKSGSRRWRSMTVTADEFIRRFLQHVLLVAAKPLPVPRTPTCPH